MIKNRAITHTHDDEESGSDHSTSEGHGQLCILFRMNKLADGGTMCQKVVLTKHFL